MEFTPTYDNLNEREPWKNLYYNTLIDDLQAKSVVSGDFTYPFSFTGSVGFSGSSIFGVGMFGSATSSNTTATRIAQGLGITTANSASDNTTNFQTMIDGLPTTSGSEVILGPGTYEFDATLFLNGTNDTIGNYTIRGAGRGATILKAATGFSGTRFIQFTSTPASATATSITLADCTVNCNQQAGCNIGVDISSSNMCEMINVLVTGSDDTAQNGDGIVVSNADHVVFDRVISHTNDGHGFRMLDTNGLCNYAQFLNCIAHTNTVNGFHYQSGGIATSSVGCKAYGNVVGFQLEEQTGSTMRMFSWDGCQSLNNTSHGFMINQPLLTATEKMRVICLSGCQAYSNTGDGFHVHCNDLDGATAAVEFMSLIGIQSFENDGYGLYIRRAVSWTIVGGTFNDNDADSSGGEDGILIDAASQAMTADSSIIGVNTSSPAATQDIGISLTSSTRDIIVQGCGATGNVTNQHVDASSNNFTKQLVDNSAGSLDNSDAVTNNPAFV